jgi:tetratricopeptide (TPR) repeat protein
MAYLYQTLQRYTEALTNFEMSIELARQASDYADEIAGLARTAFLLYQHLNRPEDAISCIEKALTVFKETGLPQDAAGNTVEDVQRFLQVMRSGASSGRQSNASSMLPQEQIQQIIINAVSVMTTLQSQRAEWRSMIAKAFQDAQQQGVDWQIEVDFFTAILDILDGRAPTLSVNHPYIQAITAIQDGIARGGIQDNTVSNESDGTENEDENSIRLIIAATAAVLGPNADKKDEWRTVLMQLKQQSLEEGAQETVALWEAFIKLLDADGNPAGLGVGLTGAYAQAWHELIEQLKH